MKARQGHRYTHKGRACLVLDAGEPARIAYIGPYGWISEPLEVPTSELVEQPMRYYGNALPSDEKNP